MPEFRAFCGICTRFFSRETEPRILECGHSFCFDCFSFRECPICRKRLLAKSPPPVNFLFSKSREFSDFFCPRCQFPYDDSRFAPRVFQTCGHTFCEECLQLLREKKPDGYFLNCPYDCAKSEVKNFPKNYSFAEELAHEFGSCDQRLISEVFESPSLLFEPRTRLSSIDPSNQKLFTIEEVISILKKLLSRREKFNSIYPEAVKIASQQTALDKSEELVKLSQKLTDFSKKIQSCANDLDLTVASVINPTSFQNFLRIEVSPENPTINQFRDFLKNSKIVSNFFESKKDFIKNSLKKRIDNLSSLLVQVSSIRDFCSTVEKSLVRKVEGTQKLQKLFNDMSDCVHTDDIFPTSSPLKEEDFYVLSSEIIRRKNPFYEKYSASFKQMMRNDQSISSMADCEDFESMTESNSEI